MDLAETPRDGSDSEGRGSNLCRLPDLLANVASSIVAGESVQPDPRLAAEGVSVGEGPSAFDHAAES